MDLASDEFAKAAVNQLMPCDAALAGKLGRDDASSKVGLVIGLDDHERAGQARAQQFGDFFRVHERYDAIL